MPMPARIRRSANCACQGAGTLIARTDAGPDGRSSDTCRNSQVPSRLRREAGITGPSERSPDGAPGAEHKLLPMFRSGRLKQAAANRVDHTRVGAHVLGGATIDPEANARADHGRILLQLPELAHEKPRAGAAGTRG